MLEKIINWSLDQRLIIVALGLAILIFGTLELQKSEVDVFPDLTAPTVTVLTEVEAMTPLEIEKLITLPIENGLNGLSGLRRIRSNSLNGISVVYAEFEWGTDIYRARQLVTEQIQLLRGNLPQDIDFPVLAPISSIMGEIMFIAVHSEVHSPLELKTVADWNIRQRLLSISGISDIIPIGGDTKQYQVILKPEKLVTHDLNIDQIIQAIKQSNQNASAGYYVENSQEYMIRGIGKFTNIKDIQNTVIDVKNGIPILIGDIAQVRIGAAAKRGTGSYNGNQAVVLAIQKQPNVNTIKLTKKIEESIQEIQNSLPDGMIIEKNLFKQSSFIDAAINNLSNALRDGAILVVGIVLLFLLSIRATAITLMAIPLSLFSTIFLLNALDISINTMTLGGMAIALGVLVDDAIIVVENIIRRLQQNAQKEESKQLSKLKVISNATLEIQSSIVFATMIILLVFLPLFFLEGMEGKLLAPLAMAYISSLVASLIVAITITPVLSYYFLKIKSKNVHETSRFLLVLLTWYEHILTFSIKRWKMLVISFGVLFIVAGIFLFSAGKSFLPEFNEGSLTVAVVALPGTALDKSDSLGREVEEVLLGFEEVVSVTRRTGRAELDPHAQGVHASEMEVTLKMTSRSKEDFLKDLRKELASVAGVSISVGQPISHRIDHMLSGSKAAIAIKIFGEDINEQRSIAKSIKEVVNGVEGTVDVMVENQTDLPQVLMEFNRRVMASYNVSVAELSTIIQTAFYGTKVTKFIEKNKMYDVVVKYEQKGAVDIEVIKSTLVQTSSGAQVPLHALVHITEARMPYMISREGMQRKTVLTANVSDSDLVGIVQKIKEGIKNEVTIPKGYRIEYGGQFQSAEASSNILMLLGSLVIFGVFLLLSMAFNSVRDAILILGNLPFALIGGVVGLYVSGGIISVATLIGFITLFGIATRNGVMMISHIHNLIRLEGVSDFETAVKQGAKERLIPILMTALAAGLAMIPLALGIGEAGSEIQAPMAMVIMFGLFSSTLLNMIILPALYLRFGSLRGKM
ncbi:MAG: CzcA family heavy metal efflux pump [Sulfurimonas sp.]|jgi:CzcA family heavy metal efflux pump|uniref:efflux RND transporter permease subunit n=1 Tax=Sulfurimonas sp. TaxID=2022749 RepID=UPI0039E2E21E